MSHFFMVHCVYVVCQSELENRINCYSRVMQDTCSASAADVNMLITIIYYAKYREVVNSSCALGESGVSLLLICDCCNLL